LSITSRQLVPIDPVDPRTTIERGAGQFREEDWLSGKKHPLAIQEKAR
jgi:hypothetical protein